MVKKKKNNVLIFIAVAILLGVILYFGGVFALTDIYRIPENNPSVQTIQLADTEVKVTHHISNNIDVISNDNERDESGVYPRLCRDDDGEHRLINTLDTNINQIISTSYMGGEGSHNNCYAYNKVEFEVKETPITIKYNTLKEFTQKGGILYCDRYSSKDSTRCIRGSSIEFVITNNGETVVNCNADANGALNDPNDCLDLDYTAENGTIVAYFRGDNDEDDSATYGKIVLEAEIVEDPIIIEEPIEQQPNGTDNIILYFVIGLIIGIVGFVILRKK